MTICCDLCRSLPLSVLVLLGMGTNMAQTTLAAPQSERYVQCDDNIVYDKTTNLEWIAGPDRRTTREEARAWVEGLSIAGGGWRMPTKEELRGLYEHERDRTPTPLLKTTGSWVWTAGETEGPALSWGFDLDRSGDLVMTLCKFCGSRGLAVRTRNADRLPPAVPKLGETAAKPQPTRTGQFDYLVGKDDTFIVYAGPVGSAVAFPAYVNGTLSTVTASEGTLLIRFKLAVDNRSNSRKRFSVADIQIRWNGKTLPITAVGFKDHPDFIERSERAKVKDIAVIIESRSDQPPTSYRFPKYIVEAPKGCDQVGLSFRGQKEVELRIATTP